MKTRDSANSPAQLDSPGGYRDRRVDFWRGICIAGMVTWHLMTHPAFPTWIAFGVIQSFNFVAEGFVFLAGISIGFREVTRGSTDARRHLKRAANLLLTHYMIVVGLVLLFCLSDVFGKLPPEHRPLEIIWSIVSLRYQPYLGDVLTVFVFLFALTPLALAVRRRFGDGPLVIASLSLFLLSHLLYLPGGRELARAVELNAHGAFDVNTWQLVFVLGIVSGARFMTEFNCDLVTRWRSSVWIVVVSSFALMFAYRLMVESDADWSSRVPAMFVFARHPLTIARLAYVLAQMLLIAMLTMQFWPVLRRSWLVQCVVILGRHSLTVFAWSIFLDYLLKGWLTEMVAGPGLAFAALLIELTVLLGLAYRLEAKSERLKGRPVLAAT